MRVLVRDSRRGREDLGSGSNYPSQIRNNWSVGSVFLYERGARMDIFFLSFLLFVLERKVREFGFLKFGKGDEIKISDRVPNPFLSSYFQWILRAAKEIENANHRPTLKDTEFSPLLNANFVLVGGFYLLLLCGGNQGEEDLTYSWSVVLAISLLFSFHCWHLLFFPFGLSFSLSSLFCQENVRAGIFSTSLLDQ